MVLDGLIMDSLTIDEVLESFDGPDCMNIKKTLIISQIFINSTTNAWRADVNCLFLHYAKLAIHDFKKSARIKGRVTSNENSQICIVLPTERVTQVVVGEFIFTVGTQEENTTYGILLTNNYSRKDCFVLHFMNI